MTSRSVLPVGFVIVVGAVVLLGVSLGFAARGVSEGGSGASPSTTLAAPTTTVVRHVAGLECKTDGRVDPLPEPAYLAWTDPTGADALRAFFAVAPKPVRIDVSELSDGEIRAKAAELHDLAPQRRGVLLLDAGPAQQQLAQAVIGAGGSPMIIVIGEFPIPAGYPAGTVLLRAEGQDPLLSGSEESVVRLIKEGSGRCLPVPVR